MKDGKKMCVEELAAAMLDAPLCAVEFGLDYLNDNERDAVVTEAFRQLHERIARKQPRRNKDSRLRIVAPLVMLHFEKKKGERGIRVRRKEKEYLFDEAERALAFCDCVRAIEEKLSKKRVGLSAIMTYRVDFPEPVRELLPKRITKRVTIVIEK